MQARASRSCGAPECWRSKAFNRKEREGDAKDAKGKPWLPCCADRYPAWKRIGHQRAFTNTLSTVENGWSELHTKHSPDKWRHRPENGQQEQA
jgi:hypothetical protein